MELKILGCHGPYPTNSRHALSGYLVREGSTNLVMDFGSGTLARLMETIKLEELNGIFISHLHYDHTSDLMPLKYALENTPIVIDIYTAPNSSNWYREIQKYENFNIVDIDKNIELKCGELRLSFYPVCHPVPTYAIKVRGNKTLFYTADTTYFDELVEYARGSDLILADCVKPHNFKGPHMTYLDGIKLKDATAAKLVATHISGEYNDHPYFADRPDILIAEEGKTFTI